MSKLFGDKIEKLTTAEALKRQKDLTGRFESAQECRPNMQCTPADGDCDPGNYEDYNQNNMTP